MLIVAIIVILVLFTNGDRNLVDFPQRRPYGAAGEEASDGKIHERSTKERREGTERVCIGEHEYTNLIRRIKTAEAAAAAQVSLSSMPRLTAAAERPLLEHRDRRVLQDDLYPPLNRAEANVIAHLPPRPQPTQTHREDSFRLMGYLKSNSDETRDAGNNVWKCMGRMKDRHSGEFYAVPANTNDDIKIPLTREMMSEKLNDIYSLPTEMRFNSPFFNSTPYTFVELPKTDLNSSMYL